jgi:hypothetical protein
MKYRIPRKWLMERAKAEEGLEIGAGSPDCLQRVVSPARTFREHMRVALSLDGNYDTKEIEQIIKTAENDTATQSTINGSMDNEPTDGQSLVACWESIKSIARGDAWRG